MSPRLIACLAAFGALATVGGLPGAGLAQASPAPNVVQLPDTTMVSARNVPAEGGLERTTVTEGLENPWALAFLPGGDMLVTERPGRLRIIRQGVLDPAPVAGVPAVAAIGQGGLLDIALHPDFAANQLVYFTYAAGTAEANHTRVARARWTGSALVGWQDILSVSDMKRGGQHFGARLAFMADRTLLVSIGDGGNPPVQLRDRLIREYAQDPASQLGKVLRIRDDGTPASGNPMAAQGGAAALVWTLGHRNIQGLAIDPATGAVWANEHGALGGDELNLLRAGANYGWPVASATREYRGGAPVSVSASAPGMTDPALLWEVATAPSGLVVYSGDLFPDWRGDLFSGGLMGQDVRRIDLDASGRVVAESAIRVGQRVRDVRQGPDGAIYVLTDERAGRLFRFAPTPR
jgi:aldose sugar dehydrogenase